MNTESSMKKKLWAMIAAIVLVVGLIIGIIILSKKDDGKQEGKNYNIIFAQSSIPPTLAAMDSILDGGNTYAFIQRGKTYAGIESVSNFDNLGFQTSNQNNATSLEAIQNMISLVKRLKSSDSKATFNIYVTDFDAYTGFAIGIYAGLSDKDYKVVMIEDGASTYTNFTQYFVTGKTVGGDIDETYDAFDSLLTDATAKIEAMKEDANNSVAGSELMINDLYAVYALATFDNAEYRVQDKSKLLDTLNNYVQTSRLTSIYNGTDKEYTVNIKSSSISNTMSKFNEEQRNKYLSLVFGADKDTTINLLQRTVDGNGNEVPSKKLVYIGSRAYNYDYALVPDITLDNYSEYMVDYDRLKELKAEGDALATLLVDEYTQEDWTAFKALLPSEGNNKWVKAFNMFQEYRYAFSYVLTLYGDEYDLLYKGHPSELVDSLSTFKDGHYLVDGITYKNEMYALVNHFHFEDSLGKRIGVMPGGVAAENFAYLGLDFAICGLNSSTYTGYEVSVPIQFVIGKDNYNVLSTANLSGRYAAGTLLDSEGNNTLVMNKGNILKALGRETEYRAWIQSIFGINASEVDKYDLSRTGLLQYANGQEITRNVSFGHYNGDTYVVDTTVTAKNGQWLVDIAPEYTGEVPLGCVFAGWAIKGQTNLWNSYYNGLGTDTEMYAVFTKVVQLVSHYPTEIDKEEAKANLTVYYNWGVEITKIETLGFNAEGYTFAGWATTENGEVVYADNAKLPVSTDVTTLYAVWTKTDAE